MKPANMRAAGSCQTVERAVRKDPAFGAVVSPALSPLFAIAVIGVRSIPSVATTPISSPTPPIPPAIAINRVNENGSSSDPETAAVMMMPVIIRIQVIAAAPAR